MELAIKKKVELIFQYNEKNQKIIKNKEFCF